MLNALTYVFSNELRRPLVWQTVSSIPPVIKEEPFRAKPDQSRFRFIVHVPISIRRGPTGRRCQKGHTRAHDRECTRSSFDTQTRSLESKHLQRMKTKKNKTEPKGIEKKGSRTSKGCRDIDAKQKERQATTSRRPYCCYLVLGVAQKRLQSVLKLRQL